MYNESQLKVASLILKDKVFKYKKTIGTWEGFTFYFTAKVTGQRTMYSIGDPYPVIQVDAKIVRVEGLGAGVFKMANHLRKTFNRVEMLSSYNFNGGMDYLMRDIGSELSKTFKVLDSNVEVQVENMTIPDDVEILDGFDLYKKKITESKVQKPTIRTIIKEEGEFHGSNKEYFLQPDKIETQYYEFKRKSDITGLTMDELIDDYFEYQAEDYDLDQSDVEEIKRAILSYR